MIEDVISGAVKAIGRAGFHILFDIIIEEMIKAPGYFICKRLSSSSPNPDGFLVIITGLLFWVVLGFSGYMIYQNISAAGNA